MAPAMGRDEHHPRNHDELAGELSPDVFGPVFFFIFGVATLCTSLVAHYPQLVPLAAKKALSLEQLAGRFLNSEAGHHSPQCRRIFSTCS
jgi:hypothetical protein